jgi:hypothetical protein
MSFTSAFYSELVGGASSVQEAFDVASRLLLRGPDAGIFVLLGAAGANHNVRAAPLRCLIAMDGYLLCAVCAESLVCSIDRGRNSNRLCTGCAVSGTARGSAR